MTPDGAVHTFVVGAGLIATVEPKLSWQTVSKDGFRWGLRSALAAEPTIRSKPYAISFDPQSQEQPLLASDDAGRAGRCSPSRPADRRWDAHWKCCREVGRASKDHPPLREHRADPVGQADRDRVPRYDVAPAESDALERAFAGRIVAVQVAAPHASFLEAYLGDVVEIR